MPADETTTSRRVLAGRLVSLDLDVFVDSEVYGAVDERGALHNGLDRVRDFLNLILAAQIAEEVADRAAGQQFLLLRVIRIEFHDQLIEQFRRALNAPTLIVAGRRGNRRRRLLTLVAVA